MSTETPRGTRARTPDLDWSQVRETVLMLELAAGQVDAAMRDSNSSVNTLMDTFTSMADTLASIDIALNTLPDTVGNGMVKAEIQDNARQVAQKVHHAIIAFQFYDKLVQRLDHVCHSLSGLSGLVSDTGRLYNPAEWSSLQELIRSKYTMVEERGMFDAVMAGATVQEALKDYMTTRMQQVEDSGGEIELF
jgi:predicted methyltransferase MtxX (methanogen marker protein 4)